MKKNDISIKVFDEFNQPIIKFKGKPTSIRSILEELENKFG